MVDQSKLLEYIAQIKLLANYKLNKIPGILK